MTPEQHRSPEIKAETPDYHIQAHTYLNNTFAHLQRVNGEDHHIDVEIKPAIEAELFEITERVERITETFQSPEYLQIYKEREELKGSSELNLTGCMDGRMDANYLGCKAINIYKTSGGIMEVEPRGDGKIIPKPPEICIGVQKTARNGKILTQGAIIHTTCAAASEIQKEVNANRPYMPNVFDNIEDQYRIGKAPTPEEANAFIAERTTLAATNNLYNALRIHEGLEPLARTGFTATYELTSRGLVIKENGASISTTDLILEQKADIERLFGERVGEYGVHKNDMYDPKNLLTITRKSTIITRGFLRSNDEKLMGYRAQLQQSIDRLFPEFLPEQKQAVEFLIDHIKSQQYLAQVNNHHSKLHHGEQYISSSRYREYYGYRDTEQVLGCRVPDAVTAAKNLPLQLKVLRGHMPAERPKIYIIGSPADANDYIAQNNGMDRSRKECLDFFKSFIRHENVEGLVKSQKLIPVPLIYDENGRILEIPDFSYVV